MHIYIQQHELTQLPLPRHNPKRHGKEYNQRNIPAPHYITICLR